MLVGPTAVELYKMYVSRRKAPPTSPEVGGAVLRCDAPWRAGDAWEDSENVSHNVSSNGHNATHVMAAGGPP